MINFILLILVYLTMGSLTVFTKVRFELWGLSDDGDHHISFMLWWFLLFVWLLQLIFYLFVDIWVHNWEK